MQTTLTNLFTDETMTSQFPNIVVVEDNIHLNELLSFQLQLSRMKAVCFLDGLSALEWFKTNTADLVVLDWMLPDIDGIEVCRRLREEFSARSLPILMLSALGTDVD